jgi:radical SAM protein with 4Fe4S-binding SPASM domain
VVISEEGEVYPCELLDKSFGSLKDYDFDFKKLWQGKKAEEIRKWILKNRCACTHECFLTINVLFSPKIYPRLLGKFLWLYGA